MFLTFSICKATPSLPRIATSYILMLWQSYMPTASLLYLCIKAQPLPTVCSRYLFSKAQSLINKLVKYMCELFLKRSPESLPHWIVVFLVPFPLILRELHLVKFATLVKFRLKLIMLISKLSQLSVVAVDTYSNDLQREEPFRHSLLSVPFLPSI